MPMNSFRYRKQKIAVYDLWPQNAVQIIRIWYYASGFLLAFGWFLFQLFIINQNRNFVASYSETPQHIATVKLANEWTKKETFRIKCIKMNLWTNWRSKQRWSFCCLICLCNTQCTGNRIHYKCELLLIGLILYHKLQFKIIYYWLSCFSIFYFKSMNMLQRDIILGKD